jgi:5'-AMP-activated protein kinase catalytic alpha subunit
MSRVIRIGNYRLGKTLGEGTFGKVKLAEHETTGHKVAVKILNRQKIKNSKMDHKIKREIKILKLFRHPHIIRLYEVIETPKEIFLVMEYVSGGELFDYIVKHGRLSESEARRFFQQIISGVEYCHRFKVVHRDLKPENLLLDGDMNVKIADFGLSNMMQDGLFLKTSCGSPNYAAPEVITGKLYAGPEVDVWSCGVILYALLCGKLPFDEETIPILFKKIREGSYTFPNHVSEPAKDLISKILVVDPLQRATMSDIRNHPWFQKDLPEYLSVPPSISEIDRTEINKEVLEEALSKVDVEMSYEEAAEAIKSGIMNDVTVAYFLILDHKTKLMLRDQYAKTKDDKTKDHYWPMLGTSPPPGQHFSIEMVMNQNGSLDDRESPYLRERPSLSSSVPSSTIEELRIDTAAMNANRWQLGIRSENKNTTAMDVMNQVYKALKLMDMKWKVLGNFFLKCKYNDRTAGKTPNVGMGLQLYKLPDGHYLLDVQHITGDTFQFIDACNSLIELLKI